MKKQTEEILKAVLNNDQTIKDIIKDQVLSLLTGKEPPTKPKLLTQNETAKFLSVSRQTIYTMTKSGILKPCVLPNGLKRYRVKDLEELTGLRGGE